MKLHSKQRIEDLIIVYLQQGPILILDMIKVVQSTRPQTTKQAVYAALRNLKKSEMVVIHNGAASLNIRWLKEMNRFFSIAEHQYTHSEQGTGHFLDLQDGEKIQYYFQSPASTDVFWTHVLFVLLETFPATDPLYLYNPHWWFMIARYNSEQALIDHARRTHHPFFMTVGAHTPLDRAMAKFADGTHVQYYMRPTPVFPQQYYMNMIGNFIIEVRIDKYIAQRVDAFYRTTKQLNTQCAIDLRHIVESAGRSKLIISHNSKKAARLQRMFKKAFHHSSFQ
ncbi:MAG: hypothetical protein HYV32_01210 [Candidatus Kerfeldbacteria bacterium]|nr:hypothetical protein [Candidatus Kerfeldbacteria bacterium]